MPPGSDAEQFGLAQLFDRNDDPGETRNLAEDAAYGEVVKTCQRKLLAQEAKTPATGNCAAKSETCNIELG